MKTLAEQNKWYDLQVQLLNDMGMIYSDIVDYDKAMEFYLKSYKIAQQESNKAGELLALNNIGRLYSLEGKYVESKKYVKKAYQVANLLKDSVRIGQIAMNLAAIENETGNLDTANHYIDVSINMLKNKPDVLIGIAHARCIKIENLYLKQDYDQAESLAISALNQIPKVQIDDIHSQYLFLLSKIYQGKKNSQKAIYYAKESLLRNPKMSTKIEIYTHLSHLYQENNRLGLAIQYRDSVLLSCDSLAKLNQLDRMAHSQIKSNLLDSEKALGENKLRQKTERILFLVFFIVVILLFVVFLSLFRIQWVKNKQRKIIDENRRRIMELELEKEKDTKTLLAQQLKAQETVALLEQERFNHEKNKQLLLQQQLKEQETIALFEQERLKTEIAAKNRQLTARLLFQTTSDELFEEIGEILSALPEKLQHGELQEIREKVKKLQKDADKQDFFVYFEQINPALVSALKEQHPNLTVSDIRLLSYMYLDLSMKEIAVLLNVLPDSLKKKKQRIATKMKITTTGLHDYLDSLLKK
jgi:tetratricopeptide (TPR) repeat protein